jgi:hypothetical protein
MTAVTRPMTADDVRKIAADSEQDNRTISPGAPEAAQGGGDSPLSVVQDRNAPAKG